MDGGNCSSLTEFIFLGITENTENKVTLFIMFLLVYLINLLANLGMITLIRMDPQLHTPMYFFLSHLFFCDLCCSTAIDPKMLVDLLTKQRSISFYDCALQFLVFSKFIDCECLLLAVMTYDQYKAISSPLLYAVSMSSRVCSLLMAGVYLLGMTDALIHMTLAFRLCFCGSNEINLFFFFFFSMLVDIFAKNKSISFCGCALQFLVFCIFADSECLLLAVMAYDQYKAISSPLLYAVSMSSGVCSLLMAGVCLVGMTDALINMTLAFHLHFCGSNKINHVFCDVPPLLLIPCSDTQVNELVIFMISGFLELSSISGVLVSYFYIIPSRIPLSNFALLVLKIHSAEGRFKAFSTCTSHLTAVAIFQGTLLFMYFRPSSSYFLDEDKMTSLFYTLVIPMLNSLIYSLRNEDVKQALEKLKNKWS
ncbi:hypothetical protein FD755_019815 [Muntiacus reevesi]|uniref:G-protein coupled receptors family 1 profile domain-containing protein n=1 Tax=Muntiacus reevesi TaxID=9886 RepID=A0A5N3X3N8_MUNRE|nr:hypothetical protein FD755_019815 [Muntiacus reevesi]